MMNNSEALILLNTVSSIGSRCLKRLLETFDEPTEIFKAGLNTLTGLGLTPSTAQRVLDAPRRFDVIQEIEAAAKKDIKILTILDQDYPLALKEIYDPPVVLYVKGGFIPADINAIGVVGSRGASPYGLSCALNFSSKLSQWGLTIVSGMARGVDTASHRAALKAKGRTIAVLGSGLNRIYPPENSGLFSEIIQQGAVVSQFPLDTEPISFNFPVRNRVISGLSKGVLVVEASLRSGALITARYALEQGREVFAIPGKLSSETSSGTNDLIKEGAKMVTDPKEILLELGPQLKLSIPEESSEPKENLTKRFFNQQEQAVMQILSDEPKYIDHISQETGLDIGDILSIMSHLELKGAIRQLPGKTFIKATECA